jgi:TIR domain
MSYPATHLFVCYSSKDEAVAREIVEFLEAKGLTCWISVRDVTPGRNYQEAIVDALEAARGIIFLFSQQSNSSQEIKKELSIGAGINLPVFPVRLSPIAPSGALRYELAIRQWIDLFPHRQHALGKLADTIQSVFDAPAAAESTAPGPNRVYSKPPPGGVTASPARAARAPAPPKFEPIVMSGTESFEAIRSLLAHHVGPIAKLLVERAAKEATSRDEFCEQLASHIDQASSRAAFLNAARARLR